MRPTVDAFNCCLVCGNSFAAVVRPPAFWHVLFLNCRLMAGRVGEREVISELKGQVDRGKITPRNLTHGNVNAYVLLLALLPQIGKVVKAKLGVDVLFWYLPGEIEHRLPLGVDSDQRRKLLLDSLVPLLLVADKIGRAHV